MAPKIAIQSTLYPDINTEIETFPDVNFEIFEADPDSRIIADLNGVDGIVLGTVPFGPDAVDSLAASVKVIGRPGVGLDNLNLPHCKSKGIGVLNCPDYCTEEVASHALALILSSIRRLSQSDSVARTEWNKWDRIGPIDPIGAQTVGIIGYGRTGSLLARWIEPIVGQVLVHDPYVDDIAVGKAVDLEELLRSSDVVSMHIPLNPETRNLLGAEELALMNNTATIVNISRGGVIDEQALAQALQEGTLGGAALDVLEAEPPGRAAPLLSAPNVLLTPHTAWYSTRSEIQVRLDTVNGILAYLEGGPVVTASIAVNGLESESSDIKTSAPQVL